MADQGSPLETLAALYGVHREHVDGFDRPIRPSADTLLGVLRGLGAPLARVEEAGDAIRERHLADHRRVVDPVVVGAEDEALGVTLRLPDGESSARITVTLENGDTRAVDVERSGATPADVEGERRLVTRASLGALPVGYHDVDVAVGDVAHRARAVVAPGRAHPPPTRAWGAFLPVHALWSERSRGIGDLTDLEGLVEWVGRLGGDYVGTLPLCPAYLDRPFAPSPYAPVSRLFWNELYLDPLRLPELARSAEAQAAAEVPVLSDATGEREPTRVDYRRLYALRRPLWAALADRFFAAPESEGLADYLADNPRALDYARFRATMDARADDWHSWPDRMWAGRLVPGDWEELDFRTHLYVQWRTDEQLRAIADGAAERGTGLYLDLPIGAHPGGYDAWRERASFAVGLSTGAPPDAMFSEGQDWGFPPRHPEGACASGLRYFADCLRHHMGVASALRIDHVMGLTRLYCIPDGASAREGAYVAQPADALYAVLALESARAGTVVVGENLGTVPDEVPAAMERRGLLKMHVLQLATGEGSALPAVGADELACLGTHDLPTFAGWARGRDVELRARLGLLDDAGAADAGAARRRTIDALAEALRVAAEPGAVLRAALLYLAGSSSPLVVVDLEDLWLEPVPHNVPGTGPELLNWHRRAARSLESIMDDEGVATLLQAVASARKQSG